MGNATVIDNPEATKDEASLLGNLSVLSGDGIHPRSLSLIDVFTTHFAEFEANDRDLIVHVFPRGGEKDRWYPPSLKDGKYIPGRLEERIEGLEFPEHMEDLVYQALSKVWLGSAAIEKIPELNAIAVQIQEAVSTLPPLEIPNFLDKFCEEIDNLLS